LRRISLNGGIGLFEGYWEVYKHPGLNLGGRGRDTSLPGLAVSPSRFMPKWIGIIKRSIYNGITVKFY